MIYTIYAIRDSKTSFMAPMLDMSDESAKRNFAVAINNNATMSYSPKDFDLFAVGSWDSHSGVIAPIVQELICNGMEVFNEK